MSIQPFNAWSAAATGFKYLPHSLAVQTAVVAGAIALDQVKWDVLKEVFFPSDSKTCNAVNDLSLLQKVSMIVGVGQLVGMGTGEEVIIRGILQDGLLTRVPKAVLGIFGKNHWVDSRPAQVVRGGISAAAFAAIHLANLRVFSEEQVRVQIANTLGLGIACAAVKERTGSVVAAMGLHGLYNALAISIPNLWLATNACSLFESDSATQSINQNTPIRESMESILRSPTCASENDVLAKKAEEHKASAEYYGRSQVYHNEKAQSLLQLAQSPYPEDVPLIG